MALYCIYRISDGQFVTGAASPPVDVPPTHGVATYSAEDRPDFRLHRFDGTAPDKKRLATAQEIADQDDERGTRAVQRILDMDPMFLAMAEVIRQEINAVRASVTPVLPDRTQQQFIARFKTIYKTVLTQLNLS